MTGEAKSERTRTRASWHRPVRTVIRVLGVALVVWGSSMLVPAAIDLAHSLQAGGELVVSRPMLGPESQSLSSQFSNLWSVMLGVVVLGVGVRLLEIGFRGAIARYFAGETLPVAVDAVNEAAVGTQVAQKIVGREFGAGVVEGIESRSHVTTAGTPE